MRQVVVLETAEQAILKTGGTVPVGVNGVEVLIAFELPRGARGLARLRLSANGAEEAKPEPPLVHKQRGDCPLCEYKDVVLAGHYKRHHPGKHPPWLGPNPVKCSKCARTFPSKNSAFRHEVATHKLHAGPKKKGTVNV